MNKEEIRIVPQLRFPEFQEDGDWTEKKLADYEQLTSGDGDWILSKDISANGEHQIVQLSSIGFGGFKERELKTISNTTFTELKGTPISKGDLLINRMVDSDKINTCIFPHQGNYVTSVDVCWIRENLFFNNYFFMNLLCTNSNQIKLLSLSSGAGRVRISKKNLFEKFIFNIPSNPKEQQKIAACLSSLDEVITAETEKLDLLQDHKKGLLQQLFPAEGETQPKIRFPEFIEDGDWEETTLGELAKFRRGSFPQPYGLEEWYDDENGMPFIQVYDVDTNLKIKPKTKRLISELAAQQSVFIEKGTIIITIQGSIGRVAITQYDAYIDRTLLLFQKFYKSTDKLFFAYVIQMLFEIEKQKAPGGIIKTITKEVLTSFVIKLPKIQEQQKIAQCLSAADELIEAQTRKIEALQEHKKGLLQQLFP